jgi:hypothetical protein
MDEAVYDVAGRATHTLDHFDIGSGAVAWVGKGRNVSAARVTIPGVPDDTIVASSGPDKAVWCLAPHRRSSTQQRWDRLLGPWALSTRF